MCVGGDVARGLIDPAGFIGDKVGGPVGAIIDPAGAISKAVGGPAGGLISPARQMGNFLTSGTLTDKQRESQKENRRPQTKQTGDAGIASAATTPLGR